MYDVVLTWSSSQASTVTGYQVTWTYGATSKSVVHPPADRQASFNTDTSVPLVHGNVIAASIVALDSLGQSSVRVLPAHATVTIPTPPPPDPPSNVDLALTGTP